MSPPIRSPGSARNRTTRRHVFVGASLDRPLRLEALEDRRLLANVTVSNATDVVNGSVTSIAALIASPGADGISLREAIQAANNTAGTDAITFASALSGQTITLTLGELVVTQALTIDARPLATNVTINANMASRIFNITATTGNFTLGGLALVGGRTTGTNGLSDNTFSGGAIRSLSPGTLTLDQITVSDSGTTGRDAWGGGIYAVGNVTLTRSAVRGNSTAGEFARGGGISAWVITLTESTVSGNSTAGINAPGGGIAAGSNLMLTQSTVSGNSTAGTSAHGGGIFSAGSSTSAALISVTRSTVTNNRAQHATAQGGGVFQVDTGPSHSFSITGSIVAGNTAAGGGPDVVRDPQSFFTVAYSLIGVATGLNFTAGSTGNLTGTTASPLNPQLDPLADNGGLTQTHTLRAGSPAIDRGDPGIAFSSAQFDQRGGPFVRVFDGDGTGGARIDIGAYERQTASGLNLVVNTVVDENDGNYAAGDLSLREAIGLANGSVGANTITFAAALSGATITLGGTELTITEALTIDARPLVQNVTINANQRSRIFSITATTGNFTLAGLTITGGRTTASDFAGRGGAIRSFTVGTLTLNQSTVSDSTTTGFAAWGGGIFTAGNLTLTQSTVSGNRTTGNAANGGGIFSGVGLTLTQSTVSGNSVAGSNAGGAGIFAFNSATLSRSTVTDNRTTHATGVGGGVFQYNSTSNFPFSISNSIIARNTAAGGGPDVVRDPQSFFTVAYSLIGVATGLNFSAGSTGNLTGTTASPLNPQLGPLANNSGPTQTHALLTGSPAIDRGDPSVAFSATQFDQRGEPFVRVFDGDGTGGARIDIGAYERQTLGPAMFVVTTTADELNYGNAAVSLREAVYSANGSVGANTITFAASLSGATITLGGTELTITEALTIDARPLVQNVTINANQRSRIFNITATTGNFTLAGLTITGGRTIGDDHLSEVRTFAGGAIRSLTSGNLTLNQTTVSGNRTTGNFAGGGGIWANGAVVLTQSTVSGNSTAGNDAAGGGIFVDGSLTLTQSTVSGNSTAGGAAAGGGIFILGDVTLNRSTVSGNSTAGTNSWGGGIRAFGAVTLNQSTVSGNSTAGNFGDGGGVWAISVALNQSTVSGNSVAGSSARGGGIWVGSVVTLNRSTVTNNRAQHATAQGGGVFQVNTGSNHSFSITGSIVAGNTAAGGGPDVVRDPQSLFTVAYSLIGVATGLNFSAGSTGNLTGTTASPLNPQLGPLANNSGPTQTHALLTGSPAIDRGDPSVAFSATQFDQRGEPFVRVFDGDGTGGARIDIGAYEFQQPPNPTIAADFNSDGVVDGADLLIWQHGVGMSTGALGADGDADGDGDVDAADLAAWQSQFGAKDLAVSAASQSSSAALQVVSADAAARDAAFAAGDIPLSTDVRSYRPLRRSQILE